VGAYRIKRKKVDRKWMFKTIQAQQQKINDLFQALSKELRDKLTAENRCNELVQKMHEQEQKTIKVVNDPRLVQAAKDSTHDV